MRNYYYLSSKLLFMLIVICFQGCRANPYRAGPVEGDLIVTINEMNQVCVMVNFDSAILADDSYKLEIIDRATFDMFEQIDDTELEGTPLNIWELTPANKSVTITKNDKICMNNKDKRYKEKMFNPIDPKTKYRIHLRGITPDGEHFVNFSQAFKYEEIKNINGLKFTNK